MANFNLYRFQKVDVKLYKNTEMTGDDLPKSEQQYEPGVIQEEENLNQRLSGEWLITSINYNYGKSGGFEQEVVLVKRELSFNDNDFDPNKTY